MQRPLSASSDQVSFFVSLLRLHVELTERSILEMKCGKRMIIMDVVRLKPCSKRFGVQGTETGRRQLMFVCGNLSQTLHCGTMKSLSELFLGSTCTDGGLEHDLS